MSFASRTPYSGANRERFSNDWRRGSCRLGAMMRETGRCGARGPRLPQLLDKLVEATSLNGMKSQPVLVGAFEAKTKLGNLLERVGRGASFIITKHDQPVARLTSYRDDKKARRKTVVAELRALRKKYNLNGISIRELRDEGRA